MNAQRTRSTQATWALAMCVALLAGLLGEGVGAPLAIAVLAIGIPALVLDGVDGWLASGTGAAEPAIPQWKT